MCRNRALFLDELPEFKRNVLEVKRGLGELPGAAISVVDFAPGFPSARQHDVGRNYCKLFGDRIDWHPEGFQPFAESFA